MNKYGQPFPEYKSGPLAEGSFAEGTINPLMEGFYNTIKYGDPQHYKDIKLEKADSQSGWKGGADFWKNWALIEASKLAPSPDPDLDVPEYVASIGGRARKPNVLEGVQDAATMANKLQSAKEFSGAKRLLGNEYQAGYSRPLFEQEAQTRGLQQRLIDHKYDVYPELQGHPTERPAPVFIPKEGQTNSNYEGWDGVVPKSFYMQSKAKWFPWSELSESDKNKSSWIEELIKERSR
jgi:hypothetical protein